MRYQVLGTLHPASSSVRQRLLLSFLLLHANRFVESSRLVEALWGDDLPSDPEAALRTQVSRLRRRLRAGALVTGHRGYRLVVGDGELDSQVFERLLADDQVEQALALWRGPALEEFADRPFAQAEAARLEELRGDAEERRAQLLLSRGQTGAAVAAAEFLLHAHPEREGARAVLMEALYRDGRQTEALDVYRAWRRALGDELGIDPSPELVRLEEEILRHEPSIPPPPQPVDSFVGRDRQLRQAGELLRTSRLLTLTGPGGVGKTRLALEVVRALAGRYADGAVFCDLGSVGGPTAVRPAIAALLRIREVGGHDLDEQLIEALTARRILLVLDGCEHVVDAVAELTDELLSRTAGVHVLATSRERLAVAGERVQQVPPLSSDAGTRLFRDRARAVTSRLSASDEEVAAVCRRLDGLPLAIELAASRVSSLRLGEMARALDDRFSVLADRRRSLAAALQWSYDLLTPAERRAFDRLAIFQGPFDRDAAAALGVDTALLLRLSERSLVTGANPYRLLDSVRAFGRARLRAQGQLDLVAEQHASWALDLATRARSGLSTADEPYWTHLLSLHFAELRAAQEWLVEQRPDLATRLVDALHSWALWRAQSEVFYWAATVADLTGDPGAIAAAATGAWQRGDLDLAAAAATAALPHRRAVEGLGEVALVRGKLGEARKRYLQAAALERSEGDGLQEIWCQASAVLAAAYAGTDPGSSAEALMARAGELGSPSALAMAHFVVGEIERNELHLHRAVELARSVGARFVSGIAQVALAALRAGEDPAAALDRYESAIQQWREAGVGPPQWVTIRTLIVLLARLGAAQDAAVLYGAARTTRTGAPPYGRDAHMLRETAKKLRADLGDKALRRCLDEGASLDDDQAVTRALEAIRSLRH